MVMIFICIASKEYLADYRVITPLRTVLYVAASTSEDFAWRAFQS